MLSLSMHLLKGLNGIFLHESPWDWFVGLPFVSQQKPHSPHERTDADLWILSRKFPELDLLCRRDVRRQTPQGRQGSKFKLEEGRLLQQHSALKHSPRMKSMLARRREGQRSRNAVYRHNLHAGMSHNHIIFAAQPAQHAFQQTFQSCIHFVR
jgi:hypothetical protein